MDETETEVTSGVVGEDPGIDSLIESIALEVETPPVEAPDAPPSEGAPETEQEAAPVEEAAPPSEGEGDDPAVAKGFERLVHREVAIQKREEELRGRESKIADLESRLAEAEKRAAAVPTDLLEQLGTSPLTALKSAGLDGEQVVRLYLAEKMKAEGKEVPPALATAIEKAQFQAELRAQRAELQRYQQAQAAQAFVRQVEMGAEQYVTRGEFKNAPTVATVAKANPGRIYNEIMDEIARDASSPGKDPKAPVLSYEEAAARVEKRWADLRSLLGGPAPGASTTATTTPAPKVAPAKGASAPTVTPKPLTRPVAKTDDDILNDIIREAETETHKARLARLPK